MVKRINVRGHKYKVKPMMFENFRFASQKEGRRYQQLRLLERAGELWGLEVQPRYPLTVVGGFVKDIVTKIGEYRADFRYITKDGTIVEDVKGYDTPLNKWKRKHVAAQYGIEVRIV